MPLTAEPRKLTLAAVLLLALAGCSEAPAERVVDLVVPVTVQPVARGTIESFVTTTGSLRASRIADILVQVRGDLVYLELPGGRKAVEGTRVERGQQIARIESPEYINGIRLRSRELALQNARNTLAERQALFEEGLAVQSEVAAAERTVADAEADVADAEIQLEKMNVLAPLTGYLTGLVDTTEETVVEANTVIGQVMDYGRVLTDLKIPNSQMPNIDLGQEVRVSNYAFREQVFVGRVAVLDPTLDPATRTFRIEVAIDNPGLVLRPGMFVKADIVVEQRSEVLVIPKELVLNRQNRSVVFVEEEGRAQQRFIETGLSDDLMVEVLEGLSEGERLITSNFETLRSRTQVRVTGESGPRGSS
jgi:RND family efflux transporter MFP subunit